MQIITLEMPIKFHAMWPSLMKEIAERRHRVQPDVIFRDFDTFGAYSTPRIANDKEFARKKFVFEQSAFFKFLNWSMITEVPICLNDVLGITAKSSTVLKLNYGLAWPIEVNKANK